MSKNTRFDLTALGEVMLRHSVPSGERLDTAARLDIRPAGAEANVAVALSQLDRCCGWVGALPDHALGRLVLRHLRAARVNVDGVIQCAEGRLGTYYIEFAVPPRPVQVIYDRAHSCTASLSPEQIDWGYLLDTRLLHITGITPALSESCLRVADEAVRRARDAGVPVSVDVNYRARLWTANHAKAALTPLVESADLLFCSRQDANRVFGISGDPEHVVRKLAEKSRAAAVIVTLGKDGAVAWDGEHIHHAPAVPVRILDRLGAGDALAAGVIHGWLDHDVGRGLQYGVAMAAMALSQHGDFLVTSRAELLSLVDRAGKPGVQR